MEEGTISIRPAQPGDESLILGFVKELADYEKLSHEVVASNEDYTSALFADKPCAEVVIAELNQKPVGMALFFHNFSTFLGRPGIYLEDLYVQPESRGFGVGKRLLQHLAGIAVERNCGRLEWSVLDWNEPAIRFYESLGAIPMDEWTVNRVTGESLLKLSGKI
jgi:GNAT superfamily N-acetyltransferase